MVSGLCEHGSRKDRCKLCAKLCEHGDLREKCKQCSKCKHGKRKSICEKCLAPEFHCPHGKRATACRKCAYERKGRRDRDEVTENEINYFYEREFKRNKVYLESNPDKLQRLHQDLVAQGIEGISVVDVIVNGNVIFKSAKLSFSPFT